MANDSCRRRQFLSKAGAALTAGVLAGCAGNGDSGDSGTTQTATGAGESATAVATGTETATEAMTDAEPTTGMEATTGEATASSPVTEPAPEPVDEYLSDANFYDGDLAVGVPFVAVGIPGPRTGFDPAAIKVATGTEVTWVWASDDQLHSVVSASTGDGNRVLDSGRPRRGSSVTYRHTFEEPGIYRYYCGVHRSQSARGAVVVAPGSDVGGPGAG